MLPEYTYIYLHTYVYINIHKYVHICIYMCILNIQDIYIHTYIYESESESRSAVSDSL